MDSTPDLIAEKAADVARDIFANDIAHAFPNTVVFGSEKAAQRIAAAMAEALDAELAKLQDPVAVHANMLRGEIAKISMTQCAHLHGPATVEQWHSIEQAIAAERAVWAPIYKLALETTIYHDATMMLWRGKTTPETIATMEKLHDHLFAACKLAREHTGLAGDEICRIVPPA